VLLCSVPPAAVQSDSAARPGAGSRPLPAACRCCPGGISRSRRRRRYPSDTSDAEWAVCEPLLPHPAWLAGKGGRPSAYCMRDVVDGIRYLTHNGPVWRALPADFPPAWTVYYWAAKWQADGSTETMRGQLRERMRLMAGRKPAPTAAVIDSQSVRAAEEVARASRGYDAGKKVNGRKRHIAVDVTGLLLTVLVTAASVQDRDAAKPLLWNLKKAFPEVRLAWADGGYAGSSSPGPRPRSSSPSRSSNGPMTSTPSGSSPAGGWSSGRWPGSPATGGLSGTTSGCPPTTRPTSTGP
jgi:transposase